MRGRRWMPLAALVLVSLVAGGGHARADAPFAQGWWWAPNDAVVPVAPPGVPTVTAPLSPPDVPEDGLYVATNPTGIEAMAALLYVIDEGATGSALTLEVTGTTAGDPAVQLCPTQSAWAEAQGGAWDTRPQYACGEDAPVGVLADDGLTMAWPLGSLGAQPAIDLALAPVLADGPQTSTFRITFAKPGPQSLTVSESSAPDPPFSFGPSEVAEPDTAFDSVDVVAASTATFGGDFGSFSGPAVQTAAPPVAGAAPRTNFVNPVSQTRGAAAAAPASATRDLMETVGMFGLILLAAIYARFSGQAEREPRSLVRFAKHGAPGDSEHEA